MQTSTTKTDKRTIFIRRLSCTCQPVTLKRKKKKGVPLKCPQNIITEQHKTLCSVVLLKLAFFFLTFSRIWLGYIKGFRGEIPRVHKSEPPVPKVAIDYRFFLFCPEQVKIYTFCIKLQAPVYDILPSTTALFSYAIGSRKLSANEQSFVVGAQTVVSLLQTTQIKQGVSFIAANKVYTSTNKTTIV